MNEQTEYDNNLKTRTRPSAKMQNMGSDEFTKLQKKKHYGKNRLTGKIKRKILINWK